ncbi:MAG: helix-turn-helix transcriptional regulator [Bacillota bacterium]|nr:helix-turn-helix transcriptional regulator [Bacillota bacterium]
MNMNVNLKLLGENMRYLRSAANMSQEELSTAAGISRNMYIRYETGKSCPPLDKLFLIAECLDIPPGLLLTDNINSYVCMSLDCKIGDIVKQYLSLTYFSKRTVMYEIRLLQELENGIYKG